MSRLMTKLNKMACAPTELRSAWAPAYRKLGSLAIHWAHSRLGSDCQGWSESSLDTQPFCLICHEVTQLFVFAVGPHLCFLGLNVFCDDVQTGLELGCCAGLVVVYVSNSVRAWVWDFWSPPPPPLPCGRVMSVVSGLGALCVVVWCQWSRSLFSFLLRYLLVLLNPALRWHYLGKRELDGSSAGWLLVCPHFVDCLCVHILWFDTFMLYLLELEDGCKLWLWHSWGSFVFLEWSF